MKCAIWQHKNLVRQSNQLFQSGLIFIVEYLNLSLWINF
ncbi:unnamed protein product [Paramecium sonneborni]|uniref:Uncharacterized protein n=1 Tax=Paramecium sonneborni TaxID=65129 RepID=A0A8S1NT07_9CILI|nr:unnamed protein product [Paramecium sonneborni]